MMVADTDVLIDFLDGRAPAAERIALELEHGQLGTTVITRFELLAGARTARQQELVAVSPTRRSGAGDEGRVTATAKASDERGSRHRNGAC